MTGKRDDKLCSVSMQYNTCTSVGDNYNYAVKFDFLSYHR